MFDKIIKKEDDLIIESSVQEGTKEYVIAQSINTQKEIARNLKWLKWIGIIILIGGVFGLMVGIALYIKLDNINILNRLLAGK